MIWHPIATLPSEDEMPLGNIVVGWWLDLFGIGTEWVVDADDLCPCATHWCLLPPPPPHASTALSPLAVCQPVVGLDEAGSNDREDAR